MDQVSANVRPTKPLTLLDLCVILAVIAVLSAILFPIFAQARQAVASGQTNCFGNLEHISKALRLYMHDNDDTPPLLCGSSVATSTSTDAVVWQDTIQPYLHTYRFCFDPANGLTGNVIPGATATHDYLDYALNYGILPTIEVGDAIAGTSGDSSWLTRSRPWLQHFVPANIQYDGIGGWADLLGWFAANPAIAPSLPVASVARPNEYGFVFCAGSFDGWGSLGTAPYGIGYCGTWVDANGNDADWTFVGPNPYHAGGRPLNECDLTQASRGYGTGRANILFLDGHANSFTTRQFLKLTPDGTHLNYFTVGQ
jgi:prepilin-type processing-associated H-X9-DG protein